MIKQETIRRFKDTVKKLMKKTDYNPSDSPFDILVLDIRKKEDRIEYCGYERDVKVQFGESLVYPYRGDVYLMYSNNAFPATLVPGSKGSDCASIFSLGLPVEKIKEVILDARLKDDLEQINAWGLIPIVDEFIPEIDGVPPETIQPNKAAYLEKIIDKISRTAILSEKGIH